MKKGWTRIAAIAALLWVFIVIVLYYVWHKPFIASSLPHSSDVSWSPDTALAAVAGVAGTLLVVAVSIGLGLTLTRRLELAAMERLVWSAAIGLGILSLAGLVLGAVGLLKTLVLWPVTIVAIATTARTTWGAVRAAWSDTSWRPSGRLEIFLASFCVVMLLSALVWALMPPTAYDALVYHLVGPKLSLQSGSVSHPLDLPYLGFPQLVETLFTWGMGITDERAAAPIHLSFALLATMALVSAGRHWLDGAAGWLAAAILLSAETVVLVSGWAYVDMALLLYSTLALLALARAQAARMYNRDWLLLSGVMAGLALSAKYTAAATLLGLVAVLLGAELVERSSRWGWKATIRRLFLLSIVAIVVWVPWLIKNLVLTGNPTYPFFISESLHWDEWRAWWYDRPGTGLAGEPLQLILAGWEATIKGIEGGAGYSATIGPIFLVVTPLLVLSWRRQIDERRRWLRLALIFFTVQYGFWLWGLVRSALLQQTRLLFPAFGILALIAAAALTGLRSIPRAPFDLAWIVKVAVVGVLVLTLASTVYSLVVGGPLSVLIGTESERHYLESRLGWYILAMDSVNGAVGQDGTVLFLWEPRSYYCEVDCLPDALLDRWLHSTHLYGYDAAAIAEAWSSNGVTHVLLSTLRYEYIVDAGFDPITPQDQETLSNLIDSQLELVEELGGDYTLYSLR